MKRLFTALVILTTFFTNAQICTITDATGCDCLDGSNDCDLLPDIQISRDLLLDASNNPETPGELGVSVSTPNTGHGPLRVVATDYFICMGDTIYSPGGFPGTCSDGSDPRQLIQQRIYHKNASGAMTYTDRWAGSMTYHASHGHMHVDDWGVYSLRNEVPGTDPLTWPIVADGAKLGFCLMDFGSCQYYYGHCRDASDNILTTDAPNYGLGGGNYSCGTSNQGITAGWTDIYHYYLDGMQIDIPATVCNGDYMLVVHVDPNNNFLEESDDNNVMVVPVTLTEQTGIGSFDVEVSTGSVVICPGEAVELSVPVLGTSYSWSNGETGSTITVSESGTYSVTVGTTCGSYTSEDLELEVLDVTTPAVYSDSVCESGAMTLSATAAGVVRWFDAETGGTLLNTGETFTTPVLTSSTSYWVETEELFESDPVFNEPHDHLSSSLFNGDTYNGYLLFTALNDFVLKSVKVYTDDPGNRMIELRNASGTVIDAKTVNIPAGESRVILDFNIAPGVDYQLGTNDGINSVYLGHASPDLQRSNTGVNFPYTVPHVVSITDSRAGGDYYYYFYDWEVKGADITCNSLREEVVAIVRECATGIEDASFSGAFELFPNPAVQEVNLSFTVTESRDLELRVVDLSGRTLITEARKSASGTVLWKVDMSGLPAGAFLVEVSAEGSTLREMVVLQ